MSRVWKHFLRNLAWPVGITAYIIALSFGATYADSLYKGGAFAVIFVFMIFPTLAWLVRDMWRNAKEKVERENREMMRTLKGDY